MVGDNQAAALNLFSDTASRLSEESVNQGNTLAAFVSVTLMAAHQRQSALTLREGLMSNREIGMAVGLLMAFHQVGNEEAFAILRKTSQDMNIKVVEVARQIIEHQNSRE